VVACGYMALEKNEASFEQQPAPIAAPPVRAA
jgi:hypothetical protein